MTTEYLAIADEDDKVVGKATYDEIKAKGLIHRAANVIVFNGKGELFMHRRAENLSLYPGMWDVKFGGMVREGETYEEAALRELDEEAGIKNVQLTEMFRLETRREENRNNRKVFKCVYDGWITLQKEEVESGSFVTVSEAKKIMAEGKLSPSATAVFKEFLMKNEAKCDR